MEAFYCIISFVLGAVFAFAYVTISSFGKDEEEKKDE